VDAQSALDMVLNAASAVFERPVAPDDDFEFGDSVSTIKLLVRLEEQGGFGVDQDILFTDSFATIADALTCGADLR
jgi:acyl carrier protein